MTEHKEVSNDQGSCGFIERSEGDKGKKENSPTTFKVRSAEFMERVEIMISARFQEPRLVAGYFCLSDLLMCGNISAVFYAS